jgi:hypothetical protein
VHLVEILLPLKDNSGTPFPPSLFDEVHRKLIEVFGGVTAFTRAPAAGFSRQGDQIERDEIVVFEVMSEEMELAWWRTYRARLEKSFKQREVIIRSHEVRLF